MCGDALRVAQGEYFLYQRRFTPCCGPSGTIRQALRMLTTYTAIIHSTWPRVNTDTRSNEHAKTGLNIDSGGLHSAATKHFASNDFGGKRNPITIFWAALVTPCCMPIACNCSGKQTATITSCCGTNGCVYVKCQMLARLVPASNISETRACIKKGI